MGSFGALTKGFLTQEQEQEILDVLQLQKA